MVTLSYDQAKKSLIMMSIYLIVASLIIKGLGYIIEFNFVSVFQSLLDGSSINIKLPKFNFDSLSFDLIINTLEQKIQEVLQSLLPTTALASLIKVPNSSVVTLDSSSNKFFINS